MPEALDTEESIKIIVPEGMVVALNPDHPDVVDWKHKVQVYIFHLSLSLSLSGDVLRHAMRNNESSLPFSFTKN